MSEQELLWLNVQAITFCWFQTFRDLQINWLQDIGFESNPLIVLNKLDMCKMMQNASASEELLNEEKEARWILVDEVEQMKHAWN